MNIREYLRYEKMKKQFRNYGLVYQLRGILAIEDTKDKGA